MAAIHSLASDEAIHRRSVERRTVKIAAYARDVMGELMPVTVSNISTDGCAIHGGFHFEQATWIWIKMPGVPACHARVVWSQDGAAGCEFESPLVADVVEELPRIIERAVLARAGRRGGN